MVDDLLKGSTSPTKNALFFHCDYANPPTLQPVHIYRALLQQIFFGGLMTEATVKDVVETFRANVNGLSEHFLVDSICNAIKSCAGASIILDGLDECERGVQQAMTKTLRRLLTIGRSPIKVLITCRDEGYLLATLNDFGRLQISRSAPVADIQSYISHSVATNLASGDLTLRNPDLKEEICSKLMDKAQGMYGWTIYDPHRDYMLRLLGFSGYIFKLRTCVMLHLTKAYGTFSSIYRKDYMTHTTESSKRSQRQDLRPLFSS